MSAENRLEPHPHTGEAAPETAVLIPKSGTEALLSRYWQSGPAVLVFLRHFGCAFCREQVAQMHQDSNRFAAMGASVVFITIGQPDDTARFCTDRGMSAPFYCASDPEKRAYRAFGLSRGRAGELFTPHVFARGFQAILHGHLQGLPKGDPFQMPGVFIVDTSGIVRYAHRHRDAADNPPSSELLAVLASL